jgi:hypothetical protein
MMPVLALLTHQLVQSAPWILKRMALSMGALTSSPSSLTKTGTTMVVAFPVILSSSALQEVDNPLSEMFNSLGVHSRLKLLEAVVEEVEDEALK